MAKDPLAEAADLERRDLGNIPNDDPPKPDGAAEADDDAPEMEAAPEPPREDETGQLREQMARMEQELALARSAYRAPEPQPLPSFDASNILPFEIDANVVESLGLPKEAAKTVGDILKVVALSAKNAATQEVTAQYYALRQQEQRAQQLRANFYGQHPELERYAPFVANVATQVKAQYPTAAEEALLPIIGQAATAQLQALGIDPKKTQRRRRRPAASDSPGSSAGTRPSARGDYGTQLLNRWAQ